MFEIIIYAFLYIAFGAFTGAFVHSTFTTYANLKSFLMGLFWPISWVAMILGGFLSWLLKKR